MNTKQMRRMASGIAAAAVLATALAVPASAAVPNATSDGQAYGPYSGNGYAGFTLTYDYLDSSTLAKLYLEIDVSGASSIAQFTVKKNGNVVSGCSVSSTQITCAIKTVRNTDHFDVTLKAIPAANANSVSITGGWSSTGYVVGGNNSHGDAWDLCELPSTGCSAPGAPLTNVLTVTRDNDPTGDKAGGYGNASLQTNSNFGGNSQSVKLLGLPLDKYSSINDNIGPDGGGFSIIDLSVNGGNPYTFQLQITYPKGSQAPKGYAHFDSNGVQTDTYLQCAGNKPGTACWTYDKKTNTATLYLLHNGTVRRTY